MNDFKFFSKLILFTAVLAFVVVGFSFLVERNIDKVTIAFLAATIIVPVFFMLRGKPAQIAANFASTMGVLGTFVGVFMGLLKFDTYDILAHSLSFLRHCGTLPDGGVMSVKGIFHKTHLIYTFIIRMV